MNFERNVRFEMLIVSAVMSPSGVGEKSNAKALENGLGSIFT